MHETDQRYERHSIETSGLALAPTPFNTDAKASLTRPPPPDLRDGEAKRERDGDMLWRLISVSVSLMKFDTENATQILMPH
jgi:hypothetical protein